MADTASTQKAKDAADAQTPVAVEFKTSPNVRKHADGSTFVKDYLITVDSNKGDLPVELIERQYLDMRQTAMQRGLFPVGVPSLVSQKKVGITDYLLVYSVDVLDSGATIKGAPAGTDDAQAVDPMQSATGEAFREGDKSARTADGKTVDTTSPATVAGAQTAVGSTAGKE